MSEHDTEYFRNLKRCNRAVVAIVDSLDFIAVKDDTAIAALVIVLFQAACANGFTKQDTLDMVNKAWDTLKEKWGEDASNWNQEET